MRPTGSLTPACQQYTARKHAPRARARAHKHTHTASAASMRDQGRVRDAPCISRRVRFSISYRQNMPDHSLQWAGPSSMRRRPRSELPPSPSGPPSARKKGFKQIKSRYSPNKRKLQAGRPRKRDSKKSKVDVRRKSKTCGHGDPEKGIQQIPRYFFGERKMQKHAENCKKMQNIVKQ